MQLNVKQAGHFVTALLFIAIPKAGVMAGSVPIYLSTIWGTYLTMVYGFGCFPRLQNPKRFVALALCAWTTAIWLMGVGTGGISNFRHFARIAFYLLPILSIVLIFYNFGSQRSFQAFLRYFRNAVYFLILYGYLQIALGPETVAIKNVTAVFGADFGDVLNKNNVLHGLGMTKIFATYQNGNLFGAALVLCLPIALYADQKSIRRILAFAAASLLVVFSGSGGAMLGLFVLGCFYAALPITSGRINRRFVRATVATMMIGMIALALNPNALDSVDQLLSARLLERDITQNPRWDKIDLWLLDIERNGIAQVFVGNINAPVPVFEVLPVAMIQFFGIFTFMGVYALVLWTLKPHIYKAYKVGVLAYLFLSIGDGGYWLTPLPYLLAINLAVVRRLDADRVTSSAQASAPAEVRVEHHPPSWHPSSKD